MAAHGKSGQGSTFSWAGNIISDVTKIGGIEVSSDTLETTTLDSTFKEFINSIADGGSVDIEGNFYPGDTTGQVALNAAVGGVAQTCVITLPTAFGATWTFSGLMTKFKSASADTNSVIPFSASIKVNGIPVLAITLSTGLTTPFFVIGGSTGMVPAASGSVYDYVAIVLTATASVTVTPTAAGGAVITVNGNIVATGQASSAIPLGAAGSVTIIVITVTEVNKMTKTYTIRVQRP